MSPLGIGLLAATALFALFVLFKSRYSLAGKDPARRAARVRFGEAKARARVARDDPAARAEALREAALVALEELGRPNLAASYARRAAR
ncbi:MAG: hypothetical protein GXP55_02165, partial [Deltaproteobacteria bacterium]|nr:hypothetical protein [Deltaproteobacteria bacterium]